MQKSLLVNKQELEIRWQLRQILVLKYNFLENFENSRDFIGFSKILCKLSWYQKNFDSNFKFLKFNLAANLLYENFCLHSSSKTLTLLTFFFAIVRMKICHSIYRQYVRVNTWWDIFSFAKNKSDFQKKKNYFFTFWRNGLTYGSESIRSQIKL